MLLLHVFTGSWIKLKIINDENGIFLLGIVALLTGCNSIQKDEFVITGTISSYPKEVLICAYQTNGDFILTRSGWKMEN